MRGQQLGRERAIRQRQNDIGKGPTDIDGEAGTVGSR
jgi:hypothetical protein